MSLRSMFLLIVGTLTLLAAVVTGLLASGPWNRYQRANQIVLEDALIGEMLANWARERGAIAAALVAPGDSEHALIETALANRQQGDANFRQARMSMERTRPILFKSRIREQADAALLRADAVRREADAALGLPLEQRPPGLTGRWLDAMTDLIEHGRFLSIVGDREAELGVSRVADARIVRHFAWLAAEHAGRERAMVGVLISSGAALDAATSERLAHNRGQIELAWDMVRFFSGAESGAAPEVQEAISAATDKFFGAFEVSRIAVIGAGLSGRSYPLSAEAWFDAATEAINSLLDVESAAGRIAATEVDRAFSDAILAIALQGGLFLCGAALASGVLLLMSRRVVEPIRRMAATMMRLSRGELDLPIPAEKGANEIVGMAAALRVFRDSALARLAMEKELRDARDLAETANRTKSEFLANMSHELRTPLNAIIGFSELMTMETLGPIAPPQYREYVRDVHDSGRHLLDVINDILDMSKIEVGRMELNEEAIRLEDILDGCRRMIETRAEAGGLAFKIAVESDLPPIRVDALKIRQIVLNLMSNAVKFTPAGGRVSCTARRDEAGDLAIEVSDTGIGMRPDDIAIAMEPFRQIDSTLARRHDGTGLGLALSRGLAELHGGRIELESAPGEGTRARLTLPKSRFEPAVAGSGDARVADLSRAAAG